MISFEDALKMEGATNIVFEMQVGHDNKDFLSFQLGNKVFTIESGRGGEILKGSYLSCEWIMASNLKEQANG